MTRFILLYILLLVTSFHVFYAMEDQRTCRFAVCKAADEKKELVQERTQQIMAHETNPPIIILSNDDRIILWQKLLDLFSQAENDKKMVVRGRNPRTIFSPRALATLIMEYAAIQPVTGVRHRTTTFKIGQFRWSSDGSSV